MANKKCPQGVICLESFTLLIIFIVCVVIVYFMHKHFILQNNIVDRIKATSKTIQPSYPSKLEIVDSSRYGQKRSTINYVDTRNYHNGNGLPINVRTRGNYLGNFEQIGFLTRTENLKKDKILPLYGRPSDSSRGKWEYHTIQNFTNIKLPIQKKSRSCTGEYGCDELIDGDTVYVEGLNSTFKVTIYDRNNNRYIPYI